MIIIVTTLFKLTITLFIISFWLHFISRYVASIIEGAPKNLCFVDINFSTK